MAGDDILSRNDLYKPVSRADMIKEAETPIDPAEVKHMDPSWTQDGFSFAAEDLPGHFLSRKLYDIEKAFYPSGYPKFDLNTIDTRLYFCHPLWIQDFAYPVEAINESPPADSSPSSQKENKFAFETKAPLTDSPDSGSGSTTPPEDPEKVKYLKAISSAWYNQTPWTDAKLNGRLAFLGANTNFTAILKKENTHILQKFLTAANKRMIKNWMGVLKGNLGNDEEKLKKLYVWFGTDPGKAHFRYWAQMLGAQRGDGGGAGHGAGKAIDINYEMNPWCPVYKAVGKDMIGEPESNQTVKKKKKDGTDKTEEEVKKENQELRDKIKKSAGVTEYSGIFKACGKIYDRALRLFVPVVSTPADKYGIKHFAERYYRNHYNWSNIDSTTDTAPYSAIQVYKFYQILNWSIRFYFNYLYGQIEESRSNTSRDNDLNYFTDKHHNNPKKTTSDVLSSLETDLTKKDLPETAEIFIDEENASDDEKTFFELLTDVVYPYSPKKNLYRFKLSQLQKKGPEYSQEEKNKIINVIMKQIKSDHKVLSHGMLYDFPNRRDPCNGIFNFSYETILAICYLIDDIEWLRAFGGFANGESGDMQHFDYDYQKTRESGMGEKITLTPSPTAFLVTPVSEPEQHNIAFALTLPDGAGQISNFILNGAALTEGEDYFQYDKNVFFRTKGTLGDAIACKVTTENDKVAEFSLTNAKTVEEQMNSLSSQLENAKALVDQAAKYSKEQKNSDHDVETLTAELLNQTLHHKMRLLASIEDSLTKSSDFELFFNKQKSLPIILNG